MILPFVEAIPQESFESQSQSMYFTVGRSAWSDGIVRKFGETEQYPPSFGQLNVSAIKLTFQVKVA